MSKFYILLAVVFLHFSPLVFSQYTVNTTLKDINPYPGSAPKGLSRYGNEILMSLQSPEVGLEPYKYNILDKSFSLIKNIDNNFWDSMNSSNFYEINGKFYFFASDSSNVQLWVTDMKTNVTTKVKDFGSRLSSNQDFLGAKVINNVLFIKFLNRFYSSDGTSAGTVQISSPSNGGSNFPDLNGEMYFFNNDARGAELWKSDGTLAGTKIVKDLNPGSYSSVYLSDENIYTVNNKIVFFANNFGSDNGLYATDGTEAGTYLLKKTYNNFPKNYKSENTNKMVFSIGSELWISDATVAGTHLLNSTFGTVSSYIQFQKKIILNSNLGTFIVDENENVTKLNYSPDVALKFETKSDKGNYVLLTELNNTSAKIYVFDGDTVKKTDILYGGDKNLVETDDRLIFNGYKLADIDGYNSEKNTELFYYSFDGTSGLEKEFFTQSSSFPRFFTGHQDKTYFLATVGYYDQLFTIDYLNKVQQLGNLNNIKTPYNWTNYNPSITSGDYIYYRAGNIIRSNGTDEGTQQISLPTNETLQEIFPLSDTAVLIKSYNQQHGFMRLWKLETNSTNLELLVEIPSNYISGENGDFSKIGNNIYFKMLNIDKNEMWKSDGTVANTKKVRDLPGYYFQKAFMKNIDEKVYFVEFSAQYPQNDKIYYVDNNTGEFHFVSEAENYFSENSFVINNELYFVSSFLNPNVSYQLNKINGTTGKSELVKSLPSGINKNLKCGAYEFLDLGDSNTYAGIYRTDGTAAGTISLVPDLTYTRLMGCVKGEFYFKTGDYNTYYVTNGQKNNRTLVNFKYNGGFLPGGFYTFDTVKDRVIITSQLQDVGYELFISDVFTSPLGTQNVRTKIKDKDILIYPNPTLNEVNITLPGGEKIISVEFVDASGRTVASGKQELINIEKLPKGIYFIKVLTKENIYNAKVIKK